MTYLRSVLLALVAALAAYFLWFSDDRASLSEALAPDSMAAQQPNLFGRQVRFHQLNADGSLHYRLDALNIEQYIERDLTTMEAPRLHLTSPSQPPWNIESEHGSILRRPVAQGQPEESEEVVILTENVKMVQHHPVNGQVTLRSNVFNLYPDRQYAETDQNVIIDTEVGRTVAGGMSANLTTGVMRLSSGLSQTGERNGGDRGDGHKRTQRVHTIVLPEQFKQS